MSKMFGASKNTRPRQPDGRFHRLTRSNRGCTANWFPVSSNNLSLTKQHATSSSTNREKKLDGTTKIWQNLRLFSSFSFEVYLSFLPKRKEIVQEMSSGNDLWSKNPETRQEKFDRRTCWSEDMRQSHSRSSLFDWRGLATSAVDRHQIWKWGSFHNYVGLISSKPTSACRLSRLSAFVYESFNVIWKAKTLTSTGSKKSCCFFKME